MKIECRGQRLGKCIFYLSTVSTSAAELYRIYAENVADFPERRLVWLVGRFASRPVPKDAADWAVNIGGPHAFLASICLSPNDVGLVFADYC